MLHTWICEHCEVTTLGVDHLTFGVDWPPCVVCRQKWMESDFGWDAESPAVFPAGMVRSATSREGWPGFVIGPTVFGEPEEPPDDEQGDNHRIKRGE